MKGTTQENIEREVGELAARKYAVAGDLTFQVSTGAARFTATFALLQMKKKWSFKCERSAKTQQLIDHKRHGYRAE